MLLAQLPTRLAWAQNSSPARIVRLSFVEGDVTVERPDMQVWAEAPVNTPLEEGFKVSTGDNSFAELQFENGDTLRQGQTAILTLTRLVQTASGSRKNRVELQQGYATIHTLREDQNDVFEVVTAEGVLTARGSALFRVDLDQDLERVEVFKGTVDVRSNRGSWTLVSDTVLVLQPNASEPGEVSQGITEDDWDHWVEDRDNRVETSETGPTPNAYTGDDSETVAGWNELSENGNWSYLPGGGYGWMPTTVGAGWAPYSTGQWCYYPGWGYTWIAAEPWGWLPFHYGGWEFVPGMGWMWFPGNFGTWSPALVNWYSGPGWIGWSPRSHPVVGSPTPRPCMRRSECGGLAVRIDAFGKGGTVSPATALAFSPTTGERISKPQIPPTTAIMLPGPAAPRPAAASGSVTLKSGNGVQLGAGATAVAGETPPRHASVAPPDSNIIYDPHANSYVNSRSVAPNPPSAEPRTVRVQPLPVENRGLSPATAPGMLQTGPLREKPTVNWGMSAPRGNAPSTFHATPPPAPSDQRPLGAGGGIEGGRGAASAHGGGVPAGAGRH
jgi:hypothetical protein